MQDLKCASNDEKSILKLLNLLVKELGGIESEVCTNLGTSKVIADFTDVLAKLDGHLSAIVGARLDDWEKVSSDAETFLTVLSEAESGCQDQLQALQDEMKEMRLQARKEGQRLLAESDQSARFPN